MSWCAGAVVSGEDCVERGRNRCYQRTNLHMTTLWHKDEFLRTESTRERLDIFIILIYQLFITSQHKRPMAKVDTVGHKFLQTLLQIQLLCKVYLRVCSLKYTNPIIFVNVAHKNVTMWLSISDTVKKVLQCCILCSSQSQLYCRFSYMCTHTENWNCISL